MEERVVFPLEGTLIVAAPTESESAS